MLNDWIVIFRLVLAAMLSGIVGFEREFHGRAAGFRTHILLCVGSTLVMLTSIHMFDIYSTKVPVDPARIAAGVITGIGFLGAGAIMHYRSSVRGLTTAASLWVVAGIGLAVGSGLYFASIVTTVITLIALMIFARLEQVIIRRDWFRTIVIETKDSATHLKAIREILAEYGSEITDFDVEPSKEGAGMTFKVGLKLYNAKSLQEILNEISLLDGVKHARWEAE